MSDFGELVTWWSVYAACLPFLSPVHAVISLISPMFVTLLLFKVSGIPLLEAKNKATYGDNPEYNNYVESTRLLLPFPKAWWK